MNDDRRECVEMIIPAQPRFVRPVRLAVGAVASLAEFDVDGIDDLRIGVNELCSALIESGSGEEIRLAIETADGLVRVDGSTRAGSGPVDEERLRLSRQILSVVSDSFGFDIHDGRVSCWIERRADDAES